MGRDIELLLQAEQGISGCRVYGWDGPWITLGRFQSPDRDLVEPRTVPWIVRPTGGKAVLHGHDVTVGMAWPLAAFGDPEDPRLARSLRTIYRQMAAPIIAALRTCGVPAALADGTRFANKGARTADCFAFASANDIVDERNGAKVCGCALQITPKAALVQASIPNGHPLVLPEAVIVNAQSLAAAPWDASGFAEALQRALER